MASKRNNRRNQQNPQPSAPPNPNEHVDREELSKLCREVFTDFLNSNGSNRKIENLVRKLKAFIGEPFKSFVNANTSAVNGIFLKAFKEQQTPATVSAELSKIATDYYSGLQKKNSDGTDWNQKLDFFKNSLNSVFPQPVDESANAPASQPAPAPAPFPIPAPSPEPPSSPLPQDSLSNNQSSASYQRDESETKRFQPEIPPTNIEAKPVVLEDWANELLGSIEIRNLQNTGEVRSAYIEDNRGIAQEVLSRYLGELTQKTDPGVKSYSDLSDAGKKAVENALYTRRGESVTVGLWKLANSQELGAHINDEKYVSDYIYKLLKSGAAYKYVEDAENENARFGFNPWRKLHSFLLNQRALYGYDTVSEGMTDVINFLQGSTLSTSFKPREFFQGHKKRMSDFKKNLNSTESFLTKLGYDKSYAPSFVEILGGREVFDVPLKELLGKYEPDREILLKKTDDEQAVSYLTKDILDVLDKNLPHFNNAVYPDFSQTPTDELQGIIDQGAETYDSHASKRQFVDNETWRALSSALRAHTELCLRTSRTKYDEKMKRVDSMHGTLLKKRFGKEIDEVSDAELIQAYKEFRGIVESANIEYKKAKAEPDSKEKEERLKRLTARRNVYELLKKVNKTYREERRTKRQSNKQSKLDARLDGYSLKSRAEKDVVLKWLGDFSLKDIPTDIIRLAVDSFNKKQDSTKADLFRNVLKQRLAQEGQVRVSDDESEKKEFAENSLFNLSTEGVSNIAVQSFEGQTLKEDPLVEKKFSRRALSGEEVSRVSNERRLRSFIAQLWIDLKEWKEQNRKGNLDSVPFQSQGWENQYNKQTNSWLQTNSSGETRPSDVAVFSSSLEKLGDAADSYIATTKEGIKFRIVPPKSANENEIFYRKTDDGTKDSYEWYYLDSIEAQKTRTKKGVTTPRDSIRPIFFAPYDEQTKGGAIFDSAETEGAPIFTDEFSENGEFARSFETAKKTATNLELWNRKKQRGKLPINPDSLLDIFIEAEYKKGTPDPDLASEVFIRGDGKYTYEEIKKRFRELLNPSRKSSSSPDQQSTPKQYSPNDSFDLSLSNSSASNKKSKPEYVFGVPADGYQWPTDDFEERLEYGDKTLGILTGHSMSPDVNGFFNPAQNPDMVKQTTRERVDAGDEFALKTMLPPLRSHKGRCVFMQGPDGKRVTRTFDSQLKPLPENPNDIATDVYGWGGDVTFSKEGEYNAPNRDYGLSDVGTPNNQLLARLNMMKRVEEVLRVRRYASADYIVEYLKKNLGITANKTYVLQQLEAMGISQDDSETVRKSMIASQYYRRRDLLKEKPRETFAAAFSALAKENEKAGTNPILKIVDKTMGSFGLNLGLSRFSSSGETDPNQQATLWQKKNPFSAFNKAWRETKKHRKNLDELINKHQEAFDSIDKDSSLSDEEKQEQKNRLNDNYKRDLEIRAAYKMQLTRFENGLAQISLPPDFYERQSKALGQEAKEAAEWMGPMGKNINNEKLPSMKVQASVGKSMDEVRDGMLETAKSGSKAGKALGKLLLIVGVAMSVVKALKKLAQTLIKFNEQAISKVFEFAPYSNLISATARWYSGREYERKTIEAKAMEESWAKVAVSWSDLKDECLPLIIAFKQATAAVLTFANTLLTKAIKGVKWAHKTLSGDESTQETIKKTAKANPDLDIEGFVAENNITEAEIKEFVNESRDEWHKKFMPAQGSGYGGAPPVNPEPMIRAYVLKDLAMHPEKLEQKRRRASGRYNSIESFGEDFVADEHKDLLKTLKDTKATAKEKNEAASIIADTTKQNMLAQGEIYYKVNKNKTITRSEMEEIYKRNNMNLSDSGYESVKKMITDPKAYASRQDLAAFYLLSTQKDGPTEFFGKEYKDHDALRNAVLKKLDNAHLAFMEFLGATYKLDENGKEATAVLRGIKESVDNVKPGDVMDNAVMRYLVAGQNNLGNPAGKEEFKGDFSKPWGWNESVNEKTVYGRWAGTPTTKVWKEEK